MQEEFIFFHSLPKPLQEYISRGKHSWWDDDYEVACVLRDIVKEKNKFSEMARLALENS